MKSLCILLLSIFSFCSLLSAQPQDKMITKDQRIYYSWGYNRAWHSPSTMTWMTESGDITIEKAEAVDRPSAFELSVYFNPGKISIPQYNARLGWEKKIDKGYWGIELGTDHMKWVFENEKKYNITGDYSGELYGLNAEGHSEKVDFDQVKATGDATPFRIEYTDGHNYAHASAFYLYRLYQSPSQKLEFLAGGDAGLGVYFPRPHAHLLDSTAYYRGDNGRFQVSGFGFHAGLRARISLYDRIFIESALREIAIKNKSKFYSPMEFTVKNKGLMLSTEFYANLSVILWKF